MCLGNVLYSQSPSIVISKFENFPSGSIINKLRVDPTTGFLFICTSKGMAIMDKTQKGPAFFEEGKVFIDVAFSNKFENWAITNSEIINLSTSEVLVLPKKDLAITSICILNEFMYIGTTKGLYTYAFLQKSFKYEAGKNSNLKSDYINILHTDTKGKVWIGTNKGEVRVEGDKWQADNEKRKVSHVYENQEGLWFVSRHNESGKQEMWLIDHFNREYDAGFGPDLYKGDFNDFCIDSKGKLYFASDAFIRYDPYEEKTENFTENVSILSKKCTSTVCDKDDEIWIGTAGDGLFRLIFDTKEAGLNVGCITEKKPSCSGLNDGVIKVLVTGGLQPFNFNWSNPEIKGNNPKNISAGNYTVTVSDKNGMQQVCSIEVPNSEAIEIEIVEVRNIKSFNGKEGRIEIKAKGGTGDLEYMWGNGSKKNFIDKLGAGDYSVTVTDRNKCSESKKFNISREKILPDLVINNLKIGQTLRINELFFKADSTEITQESYTVLDEIYVFLSNNPTVAVEIGGHTNTIPSHEYCDKLSTERAKSVASFFYNKGIPLDRLTYKGYGKRKPITESSSLEGRRKNQRVEVKIVSI